MSLAYVRYVPLEQVKTNNFRKESVVVEDLPDSPDWAALEDPDDLALAFSLFEDLPIRSTLITTENQKPQSSLIPPTIPDPSPLKSLEECRDPLEFAQQFPRLGFNRLDDWTPWYGFPEQPRTASPTSSSPIRSQSNNSSQRLNPNQSAATTTHTNSATNTSHTSSSAITPTSSTITPPTNTNPSFMPPEKEGPGIAGTGQIDASPYDKKCPAFTAALTTFFNDNSKRYFNQYTLERKIELAVTLMNKKCFESQHPPIEKCNWKLVNDEKTTIAASVLAEFEYVLPDEKELGSRFCGTEYGLEFIRLWESCYDFYEISYQQLIFRKERNSFYEEI